MKWEDLLNFLWNIKANNSNSRGLSASLQDQIDSRLQGPRGASFIDKALRLQKAIILFTGASVASVRDPSLFDKDKVKYDFKSIWRSVRRGDPIFPFQVPREHELHVMTAMLENPQQSDYQDAKEILTELANGDLSKTNMFSGAAGEKVIWRMIHLHWKQAMDLLNPLTMEGDLGTPVSTSYELGISDDFGTTKIDRVNVLFAIEHKNKGSYINDFSVYDHESEVVTGGRYKINHLYVSHEAGRSSEAEDRQTAFNVFKAYHFPDPDNTKMIHKNFYKGIVEKDTVIARNKHLFPNMDEEDVLIIFVNCELI